MPAIAVRGDLDSFESPNVASYRMRFAPLLLTLGLLAGCESILGIDSGADDPQGYVLYTSSSSGNMEVWAVADTGGAPIRITDGLGIDAFSWLRAPTPSPDGTRFSVGAARTADGAPSLDRHVWVFGIDGGHPRYVVRTNAAKAFYGMSWEPTGDALVYADDEGCSNNLLRVFVDRPGSEQVIYDVETIAAEPQVNPTDANDVLFVDQSCGTVGTLRRLAVDTGEVSSIPNVAEDDGRYRNVSWSKDGTRFALKNSTEAVAIHDLSGSQHVLPPLAVGAVYSRPVFDGAGRRLFAKYCAADGACDIVAIEIDTGLQTLFGLPNILEDLRTTPSIGWAPFSIDIDADDDGLADRMTFL